MRIFMISIACAISRWMINTIWFRIISEIICVFYTNTSIRIIPSHGHLPRTIDLIVSVDVFLKLRICMIRWRIDGIFVVGEAISTMI